MTLLVTAPQLLPVHLHTQTETHISRVITQTIMCCTLRGHLVKQYQENKSSTSKTRLYKTSKKTQTDRHGHYSGDSDNVCVRGVLLLSDAHADVRSPQTKGVLWWWNAGCAAVSIREPPCHTPVYLTIFWAFLVLLSASCCSSVLHSQSGITWSYTAS